jgi:hypothetical protein
VLKNKPVGSGMFMYDDTTTKTNPTFAGGFRDTKTMVYYVSNIGNPFDTSEVEENIRGKKINVTKPAVISCVYNRIKDCCDIFNR